MGKIFISYRRGGVRARTYRLADELKRRFGRDNVFLDIESIKAGTPFADVIREAIRASSTVLIMIGPKWIDMKNRDGQRRLDDERDHLRIEVETALKSSAVVIPVLLDGATMPERSRLPESIARLADLNAHALHDSHWEYDVERLVADIAPESVGEKWNTQSLFSLGTLALVFLGLADGENDSDVWVGAGAISLVAVGLSAWAVFAMKPRSRRNRILSIGSLVLAVFVALGCFGNVDYTN